MKKIQAFGIVDGHTEEILEEVLTQSGQLALYPTQDLAELAFVAGEFQTSSYNPNNFYRIAKYTLTLEEYLPGFRR